MKYIDSNQDTQLWIASSMGQKATKEDFEPTRFYWEISDLQTFINSICGIKIEIKPLPQMIPCYSFKGSSKNIDFIYKRLLNIKTNAKFKINSVTETTLAFFIDTNNLEELVFKDVINNKDIKTEGMIKKLVNEDSGCSAYHVPEGVLFRYGQNLKNIGDDLLNNEGLLPTDYIHKLIYNNVKAKN